MIMITPTTMAADLLNDNGKIDPPKPIADHNAPYLKEKILN
jgi:hypothetical protein